MTRQSTRSLKLSSEGLKLAKKALQEFPSQADLAAQLQMSRTTVSNFFAGKAVQRREFLAICKKLKLKSQQVTDFPGDAEDKCDLKSLQPEIDPQTDNPSATTSVAKTPPENVSDQGIDPTRFIGRERELTELHELLQQNGQVAITAVAGMAGVGKTELAIQYARQHLADYPGGACRLAGQKPQMRLELIRFFEDEFNLIAPDDRNSPSPVQFCWKHWQRDGEVLVLLDDVKRYREIEDYLPPRNFRFKVLMTTQLDFSLNSSVQQLPVKVPELKAASDILESFIGKSRISQESEIAAELCQWLGCLPLALTLVGSYLQEFPKLSLKRMLARLKSQKLQHACFDPKDPTRDKNTSRALAAAFELSWERLGEMDENAQTIGCRLSLYALAPIPLSFEADESDGEEVEVWETAIKNLRKLHLLDEKDTDSYQLHSLIREFLREKLAQLEDAEDLKGNFAARMVEVAKKIEYQITRDDIVNLSPWIPHLEELANLDNNLIQYLSDEDLILPFTGLGRFYQSQGFYNQAIPWYEKCLPVTEKRPGLDNSVEATSRRNLAAVNRKQGRYGEAEHLLNQALELGKTLHGEDNLSVAYSLNEQAFLYRDQGDYMKAQFILEKACDILKNLLGEDHPHVRLSQINLADMYRIHGRYSEAKSLYEQYLKLFQGLGEKYHIYVVNILNNWALLYKCQGYYNDAEKLYTQALELCRRLRGEDHPDVAAILHNLVHLYCERGYGEVEPLLLQALEIRERRLGTDHPLTVKVSENLEVLRGVLNMCHLKSQIELQVVIC